MDYSFIYLESFSTQEKAKDFVRGLFIEDCKSIGITNGFIINELLNSKYHPYRIYQDNEMDEVGNVIKFGEYDVYKKIIESD